MAGMDREGDQGRGAVTIQVGHAGWKVVVCPSIHALSWQAPMWYFCTRASKPLTAGCTEWQRAWHAFVQPCLEVGWAPEEMAALHQRPEKDTAAGQRLPPLREPDQQCCSCPARCTSRNRAGERMGVSRPNTSNESRGHGQWQWGWAVRPCLSRRPM